MSITARHLRIVAPPAAIAVIALAAPALAHTVSSGHAAATKTATKCFTITVKRKHVRECLVPGPRGPQGVPGPEGPRGFLGPKGSTGKTGSTGKAGPTGKTGATGAPGAQGLTGPPGTPGTAGGQGATGPAGPPWATAYAVVQPGPSPLLAPGTHAFSTVTSPQTGIYCLTATGVSSSSTPAAAVSGESSYDTAAGLIPLAVLFAQAGGTGSSCSSGQYEVHTYDAGNPGGGPNGHVAFSIVVP